MPKLRHTSAIGSPSRSRATNRKRSSTTEHSFHGINTSRQRAKSVTHVSGTKCHPCLGPFSRQPSRVCRRPAWARRSVFAKPRLRAPLVSPHRIGHHSVFRLFLQRASDAGAAFGSDWVESECDAVAVG